MKHHEYILMRFTLKFFFTKWHLKTLFAMTSHVCSRINMLTHWSLNKMATTSQMIFSNAFSWEKMNNKLILVQVMTCCLQTTCHNLYQCWQKSMPPYGFTRPQRVKLSHPDKEHIMYTLQIDGLMQERRNSSALAMELRLSCINPSRW